MNFRCFGLTVFFIASISFAIGCNESPNKFEQSSHPAASPLIELDDQTRSKIERFCGDCHAMPLPSTFPKANWPEEVRQGFAFYIDSHREDLDEPSRADVVRYFQEAAPERVLVPRADSLSSQPAQIRFERKEVTSSTVSHATAQLWWNQATKSLMLTDMHAGTLLQWSPQSNGLSRIASGRHICRATQCDWNIDGKTDYLLAEMGTFPVGDHHLGRVSLLIANDTGFDQPIILAEQISRAVEAVAIDYDEDGDLDVVVADFGWRRTGALRLLRNNHAEAIAPILEQEILDNRHGALGVQLADMNKDGRMDMVVSYGQEFESVEIHYNRAPGIWNRDVVFRFPDPSYNASSLQIVDLDRDGLPDIVHTCGDTMDALIPKPYHGVHWLRNLGNEKFENNDLGLLVGALQATIADLDQDGDLDIAAVGLFPDAHRDPGAYDSICWWEQQQARSFVRHSVERDSCNHAACTTGDVDQDGRVDLIVGDWLKTGSTGFQVYYNRIGIRQD